MIATMRTPSPSRVRSSPHSTSRIRRASPRRSRPASQSSGRSTCSSTTPASACTAFSRPPRARKSSSNSRSTCSACSTSRAPADAASKFAVEGLSESLTYELASLGIVVKLVEPGGVLDSQFTTRSGAEAAIAEYAPFLAKQQAVLDGLRDQRAGATSEGVASVIFDAATDGTDQLRYVATPQIKAFSTPADRRRRNSTLH